MKATRLARATAFAVATFLTLGAATLVRADTVMTPAAACRPFGKPSAAALSANASNQRGTDNRDLNLARTIICPVVRNSDSDGVTVFVDGESTADDAPISCLLYSHNFDGTELASKGFVERNRIFDTPLALSAAEAPFFAYLNVVCTLPSLSRGTIFGVLTID
jgi:hypothetical protein